MRNITLLFAFLILIFTGSTPLPSEGIPFSSLHSAGRLLKSMDLETPKARGSQLGETKSKMADRLGIDLPLMPDHIKPFTFSQKQAFQRAFKQPLNDIYNNGKFLERSRFDQMSKKHAALASDAQGEFKGIDADFRRFTGAEFANFHKSIHGAFDQVPIRKSYGISQTNFDDLDFEPQDFRTVQRMNKFMLEKIPPLEKPLLVYRVLGHASSFELPELSKYAHEGSVIPIKSLTSTTVARSFLNSPKAKSSPLMVINLPQGFPAMSVSKLSKFDDESEVLLPYTLDHTGNTLNYGFKVKKVETGTNDIHPFVIHVDVVKLDHPIGLSQSSKNALGDPHSEPFMLAQDSSEQQATSGQLATSPANAPSGTSNAPQIPIALDEQIPQEARTRPPQEQLISPENQPASQLATTDQHEISPETPTAQLATFDQQVTSPHSPTAPKLATSDQHAETPNAPHSDQQEFAPENQPASQQQEISEQIPTASQKLMASNWRKYAIMAAAGAGGLALTSVLAANSNKQ